MPWRKWGGRAAEMSGRFSPGLPVDWASSPSSRIRSARATAPTPNAVFARNLRRHWKGGSVHIEELVGIEELLGQAGEHEELSVAGGLVAVERVGCSRAAKATAQSCSSGVIERK